MRVRLWISGVVALIWAVSVVGSQAQLDYTIVSYWDSAASTTSSNTVLTGVSGNLAVGNYDDLNGFVYDIANKSYSSLNVYTSTDSVHVSGIQEQRVVGTYYSGGSSYGFVRNLSGTGASSVFSLGEGTQGLALSGNYILATNASGQYIVYNTSNDVISILPIDPQASYVVTGIGNNTVVGYYDGATVHGFTYTFTSDNIENGDLIDNIYISKSTSTTALFTKILGIDETGTLVGISSETAEDGSNSFAFAKAVDDEAATEINPPDTTNTVAYGVDGQKVVGSASQGGNPVGVISQVPEPTTYVLIALGMLVMAISRCKTRFSRQS